MKKQLLIFIFHCLLCVLLVFLLKRDTPIIDSINYAFYISGFYLTAGLLLLVVSRGFFDITVESFKKVFTRIDKKRQWEGTWQDPRLLSEKVTPGWIRFCLIQGGLMLVVMAILLAIYY
ncbi:DUF3899 domain-containing protein [Gracilibacillus xinjiangensis]|uniref:DUF3899 domain-containing protein n=1 Tax=Gracilibacillus xinjiangensis TaxID=1193282 RepID=A0ABV8WW28_9BACI